MAASSTRPTIEDGQVYLDYLAAVQAEQQEILAVFYESELNNPPQNQSLLTDSEILSLFDSGYDVDMIIKAYPEFTLKKIKELKRKWSDKQHRHKKKKKRNSRNLNSKQDEEEKSNENRDNSNSNSNSNSNPSTPSTQQTNSNGNRNNGNNDNSTPSQTVSNSKRKRRRRAKSKNSNNSNSNTPKNNHKCSWCHKQFGSEKALKQHFKDNPHMHEAI